MMENTAPLIRVVDDDLLFLASQKRLIGTLGWEVETYPSAALFLEKNPVSRPGCLVCDVRMPEMTGLELQEELARRRVTGLPVIFLSAHGDIEMAVSALHRGAADFLEKPADPAKLLACVSRAVVSSIRRTSKLEGYKDLAARYRSLTGREKEVGQLVAQGLRNKEIARNLGIEESTVKMHRANALAKLGARTSAELTRILTIIEFQEEGEP